MTHIIFCLEGIQQLECKLEIGKCNSEIQNFYMFSMLNWDLLQTFLFCGNELHLTFLSGINVFYNILEKIVGYFS